MDIDIRRATKVERAKIPRIIRSFLTHPASSLPHSLHRPSDRVRRSVLPDKRKYLADHLANGLRGPAFRREELKPNFNRVDQLIAVEALRRTGLPPVALQRFGGFRHLAQAGDI